MEGCLKKFKYQIAVEFMSKSILYVGNGNYKHRGARYYDVGRKLCNGLVRNGHNVYFLSDRDAARSATIFGCRKLGVGHCNSLFLDICRNFSPELILIGHADIISAESLKSARVILPGVKIAQFNVDAVFNPHTIAQIANVAPLCDATFVTTAGQALKRFSGGGIACYIPNPVDPSIEWPRCHEHSDQPHDMFWAQRAMDGSYDGDPRFVLPMYLEQSGQVSVDYHGMKGKLPLFGRSYYSTIAKSKMGLNLSRASCENGTKHARSEELYLYSSDRLSHYMGSGLLTFSMRGNRLEELFAEDKEMIFFSSKEELLEKAIYYRQRDEERMRIAHAGWLKSHQHFNERLIAQYIVEVTFRKALSQPYAWPTQTY
jgi:glycosyl transferase family 1